MSQMAADAIYRVQPFDGTSDATDFTHQYEMLSIMWPEEEKILKFGQHLKGAATHWLEFMRNGGTLKNKLFANCDDGGWPELRAAFLKEFQDDYGIEWYTAVQKPDELGLSFF
jgi:hypothetical protein